MAHGLTPMPSWYYAPTQYVETVGETYCPRHKNKCSASCPYRVPIKRRTPVPLSKLLVGRGRPGFIQNYGLFGDETRDGEETQDEGDMGLNGGGGHHHGGHHGGSGMRMFYGGYGQYPWWYSPMQYETTYEIITDEDGNKVKRVRRPVPITENPPEGQEYGVFGGSLSGIFARQRTRGLGADGDYGVLSKKCPPYGSLSRRYAGNTGSLGLVDPTRIPRGRVMRSNGVGDDGDFGVLSKKPRLFGSLSRRYAGNTGSLGADPAPAAGGGIGKWLLAAGAFGLGWLYFKRREEELERKTQRQLAAVRRLAVALAAEPVESTAIVPYEET